MTEDEARTKWCPMVHKRQNILVHDALDGDVKVKVFGVANDEMGKNKCIASDCMIWVPERNETKEVIKGNFITVINGGCCGLTGR